MSPILPPEDPVALHDFMLDMIEKAYLARDFEAFASWFHLPHIVGTFDGDYSIETREALERMFTSMIHRFDGLGVIALDRKTLEAQYIDAETVQATFQSYHIMRGNVRSSEVIGHVIARRIGGQWKLIESRYATQETGIDRALRAGRPAPSTS